MTLSAGSKLGPYEILAPLGAGGMGEVYRARDTRLGREVAVKVLPASFSTDPDRLSRFEHEARAAGILNHPNITAVYDVGSHEGMPYVVSELLEGETLRSRLASGPLPPRRAVDYATQITRGLAAAHEKGIVHRDLKPENLFLTKDGRVKILDFGLAKLTHPESKDKPVTELPTATAATEAGVVLGTLGYMSPEQVRGQPVNPRSDIFAFGAVLYEMLTGKRAFTGASAADVMTAILTSDPPDLPTSVSSTAPALEGVVRHCLEKNPAERFQSAQDLAFNLATLSGISLTGSKPSTLLTERQPKLWVAALVVLGLLAGATTFAYLAGKKTGFRKPLAFSQLTFRRGFISGARFGPDGHTFVYSAAWEGKPSRVSVGRFGSTEASELPHADAFLLAVSSSGETALKLRPSAYPGFGWVGTLARAPLAGGAARELLERVEWADWSSDGKSLAIVRDQGGKDRLEFPTGKVLYETAGWISHPRISFKGDLVAFLDHPNRLSDGGSVAVVDLTGKERKLSEGWASIIGLSWAPEGREIWFTGSRGGLNRYLYAVSVDVHERLLANVPGALTLHDVSTDGRVLLSRDGELTGILALAPGETKERELSWLDSAAVRDLSADGKTLLFDETGEGGGPNGSCYIRKTDGSPAVRLGDAPGFALSPDGKWVVGLSPRPDPPRPDPRGPVLLPTGAGESRRLPSNAIRYNKIKFFSDGQRILSSGREPGRGVRLYVQDLAGGSPRTISPEGVRGFPIAVSPDGKLASAIGPDGHAWLYPVEGGQPVALKGLAAGEAPFQWSSDGRFLYAHDPGRLPAKVFRVEQKTGRRELWRELMPSDPAGVQSIFSLYISADGMSYAYSYSRSLSDLYLVEGIR